MKKINFTEELRHRTALTLAHGGWWGAVVWAIVLTYFNVINPLPNPPMPVQRISGIFIILLMGVGIAACSSLSRMRLSKTISKVFETGLTAAVSIHNVSGAVHGAPTCIIQCNMDGEIQSVEHGEVIGWPNGEGESLVGLTLDHIIPQDFLRVNNAALEQYRVASKSYEAAVVTTFNLPLIGADGVSRPMRLTIARLGDTLVKSISPLTITSKELST
jgi:hypothetical protein